MTKAELVDKLASEGGITKVQANKVLGALVEAVIAAMLSCWAVLELSRFPNAMSARAAIPRLARTLSCLPAWFPNLPRPGLSRKPWPRCL